MHIRKKLVIGAGSVLRRFSSKDIHQALFGVGTPKLRSLDELKEGIRRYARKRYARG